MFCLRCGKVTRLTNITEANPKGVWAHYCDLHDVIRDQRIEPSADRPRQNNFDFGNGNFESDTNLAPNEPPKPAVAKKGRTRSKPGLSFGQKTWEYPFGYGYCQCGCGQLIQQTGNGVYPKYRTDHNLTNQRTKSVQVQAFLSAQDPKTDNWRLSGPVKYKDPDQMVLEEYHKVARQCGDLRRKLTSIRLEIEEAIKTLENQNDGPNANVSAILSTLRHLLSSLKSTV